jgi:hypothetical protein
MEETIKENLRELAAKENIKILYACESGSRAWGFPSKDSDYDVRFIYIRARDWYLSVDYALRRDVVEQPINDLLDVNGWDLKKALLLLKKSNPALIEWINSPIVYGCEGSFREDFQKLVADYYSPKACFHHYENMATTNYRGYLKEANVRIKKYFYVLRPLLAMRWIAEDRGVVPMEFSTLVDAGLKDQVVKDEIAQLLEKKKAGFEAEYAPGIPVLDEFIESELAALCKLSKDIREHKMPYDELNSFFLRMLNRNLG